MDQIPVAGRASEAWRSDLLPPSGVGQRRDDKAGGVQAFGLFVLMGGAFHVIFSVVCASHPAPRPSVSLR